MNESGNETVKIAGAALIGALFEAILLYIFYNVVENLGGGSLLVTAVISIVCFLIVPSISKASSDIEISTKFGIAQGAAMIIPTLSMEDLSFAKVLNVILIVAAVIFYILGVLELASVGEWKGSFIILMVSCCLQSLYAFSFGTMGAIIIAMIFAMTQSRRKRR